MARIKITPLPLTNHSKISQSKQLEINPPLEILLKIIILHFLHPSHFYFQQNHQIFIFLLLELVICLFDLSNLKNLMTF